MRFEMLNVNFYSEKHHNRYPFDHCTLVLERQRQELCILFFHLFVIVIIIVVTF